MHEKVLSVKLPMVLLESPDSEFSHHIYDFSSKLKELSFFGPIDVKCVSLCIISRLCHSIAKDLGLFLFL